MKSGKELHRFSMPDDAVAFSADGHYALSCADRWMHLWKLPDPPPAKKNP
jgi:hypothetical protein